jgi:hypothetical protein
LLLVLLVYPAAHTKVHVSPLGSTPAGQLPLLLNVATP